MNKIMCSAYLLASLGLFLAAEGARPEQITATAVRMEKPQPVNRSSSPKTTVEAVEAVLRSVRAHMATSQGASIDA